MSVDYSKIYKRHQLEPFFPNELIKMFVSVLTTMAVIMLVVLLLPEPREEPANPTVTPPHIKPEWYFLAVYQSLKLMPQSLVGISGKILGVFLQGVAFVVLLTVPFWYRRMSNRRPGWRHVTAITVVILLFLGLSIWGLWPEDENGNLGPAMEFYEHHSLFVWSILAGMVFFYVMMLWENQEIRRRWDV